MSDQESERDFAAILADFEQTQASQGGTDPKPGDRVSGTILSIGRDQTFVDVGAKSDAVVATAELLDADCNLTKDVGDEVSGMVSGRDAESGCLMLRVRPGASGGGLGAGDRELAIQEITQAHQHGLPVEGTVSEAIKGGVAVTISGLRAFCPISQLDLAYIEDASTYVGQNLSFRVRKVEAMGRGGRPDIVVSRRDLLEEERKQRQAEALEKLKVGAVVRGTVTSVTGYGAFLDLGGIEGLLHVSEMAHGRVEDPSTLVAEGQALEVKVLSIEEREASGKGGDGKTSGGSPGGNKRISLSRRALLADPWEGVAERFPIGDTVSGRVVRLETYGAFVELAPGLEGLVHVSEMASDRRVSHPREVLDLGHDVEVRILDVDTDRKRIGLRLAHPAAAQAGDYDESNQPTDTAGTALGSLAAAFDKARTSDK